MEQAVEARPRSGGRVKFFIGGLLIIAAIAYLDHLIHESQRPILLHH